jgi:hypothetical protein
VALGALQLAQIYTLTDFCLSLSALGLDPNYQHNVGPWYPTIHNTTGGAILFVCNTTNGGPTISAKDMRGEYAKQSRQSGGGTISISADDDSPAHTHSALSAFDLATGDLLSSVVVAAPLTWMGALSTKAR